MALLIEMVVDLGAAIGPVNGCCWVGIGFGLRIDDRRQRRLPVVRVDDVRPLPVAVHELAAAAEEVVARMRVNEEG